MDRMLLTVNVEEHGARDPFQVHIFEHPTHMALLSCCYVMGLWSLVLARPLVPSVDNDACPIY